MSKNLQALAEEFASIEYRLKRTKDQNKIKKLQNRIITLSNEVDSIEDLLLLDDLIQEEMKKLN